MFRGLLVVNRCFESGARLDADCLGGKHNLFLSPFQPLEKCLVCNENIPISLLPDHVDQCENLSRYSVMEYYDGVSLT